MDACSLRVCASSKIWAMCLKKRVVGRHPWTRAAGCLLNLWTMHAVGYPYECLVSFPPKSLRLCVNPYQHWQPTCKSSNHAHYIYLFRTVCGTFLIPICYVTLTSPSGSPRLLACASFTQTFGTFSL